MDTARAIDYKRLKVTSSAFKENGSIPVRYTCDGDDINPPLSISQVPAQTKSIAIVVDDLDAPGGSWVHWVMWNIPPSTRQVKENEAKGLQGLNDFGRHHYRGPCPPRTGIHRYFFKIYALNCVLDLPASATKHDLEKVMSNNIVGFGELVGLYTRKK